LKSNLAKRLPAQE